MTKATFRVMLQIPWWACLIPLLGLGIHPAGGSRHNDSSEVDAHSNSNSTRQWSTGLVSAPNPLEERILNSERSRETSGYSLHHKIGTNQEDRATPEPEGDFYESALNPEDTAPIEEDILTLERNRESVLSDNIDTLPFNEPSDTFYIARNKDHITELEMQNTSSVGSPVEEDILGSERDRDETLSDIFRPRNSNNEQNKNHEKDYHTGLSDKETENSNDTPKFEFLIGLPLDNFTHKSPGKDDGSEFQTRKPFVPPKSAWPVPQAQSLTAEPKLNQTGVTEQDSVEAKTKSDPPAKAEDYPDPGEKVKSASSENANKSAVTFVPNVNETFFFVENDAPDTSFTDLQTLFLACFATLVPLLVVLVLACGLRIAWRRYTKGPGHGPCYEGHLRGCGANFLPAKRPPSPSNKLKSAESGFSGELGEAEGAGVQPPANGSIITMTLKNNHLIVETEVRNDIAHGARETKMKYSPNNDGVFVVEVQQSNSDKNRYRPTQEQTAMVHRSPLMPHASVDTDEEADYMHSLIDNSPNIQNGKPKAPEKSFGSTNTGLSTSDLSISSASSHNPSYSYGNQIGYEQGPYGYPVYAGYIPPPMTSLPCESSREPLVSKTPTDPDKPIVTAAIFKQDSIITGEDAIKSSGYNIEGSTDGPLLSDIQAREVSLHKLQDKIENGPKMKMIGNIDSVNSSDNDEERYQEQQRQLGNGTVKKEQTVVEINHDKSNQCLHRADSLPPRLIDEPDFQKNGKGDGTVKNGNNDGFDTIEEEANLDCYPGDIASGSPLLGGANNAGLAAAGARSKRASLPLITPDLYSTIKQTTKNILPSHSPKFEKFSNDNSPLDTAGKHCLPPPLITVTEEPEGSFCSAENEVGNS